jgi:hypothetical protein
VARLATSLPPASLVVVVNKKKRKGIGGREKIRNSFVVRNADDNLVEKFVKAIYGQELLHNGFYFLIGITGTGPE